MSSSGRLTLIFIPSMLPCRLPESPHSYHASTTLRVPADRIAASRRLAWRVPSEVRQRGQRLLLTAWGVGDDQPERPPSGVHGGVQGRHRDVDRIALGDWPAPVPRPGPG